MKTKKLIIILSFIVGALLAWQLWRQKPTAFKVVAVWPINGATGVDFNAAPRIEFDQPPTNLAFLIQPKIDYSLQIADQTATLTLNQPLQSNQHYSLTILKNNKEIFSWSFTTRKPSESEGVIEEMQAGQESYPLAKYLPYQTESFEISYEGPLLLRVVLKGANQNQVLSWIESVGVDPVSHQIEWVTPGP